MSRLRYTPSTISNSPLKDPNHPGDSPYEFPKTFPKSILRKTTKKFSRTKGFIDVDADGLENYYNESNNNPNPDPLITKQARKGQQPLPASVDTPIGKDETGSAMDINNNNESNYDTTEEETSSSKLVSLKACGAQFPVPELNQKNKRDLNNNDFDDDGTLKQKVRDDDDEAPKDTCVSPTFLKKKLRSSTISFEKNYSTGVTEPPVDPTQTVEKVAVAKRSVKPRKGILALPEKIHSRIFSYLNQIELHTCTQVCKQWREYYDTFFNEPRVFNGRGSSMNGSLSRSACQQYLATHLLSPENKRHYKLYFYNTKEWQMETIVLERLEEFQVGVKHMSKLHLVNCNLKWKTLIALIQSMPHLNTFTDTWSYHFRKNCPCYCMASNSMKTRQGNLQTLYDKIPLHDLRNKHTRIRVFRLTRKSVTKDLTPYFQIITRMIPYVEEFEFNIGPWTTPKRHLAQVNKRLNSFAKSFQNGMSRIRKNLKKLKIHWDDKALSSLFDKCIEALHTIEFPRLAELSLEMCDNSMKNPRKLPHLVRFMNGFEWKEKHSDKIMTKSETGLSTTSLSKDKNNNNTSSSKPGAFLLLRAYIGPVFMSREWIDFLCTFQDRILRRKLKVSLRIGVKVDDEITSNQERSMVHNIFKNYVFFRGLKNLQVNIQKEQTQALRDVVPGIRAIYPNVETLTIKVGVNPSDQVGSTVGNCFSFREYSIMSIAFNFKFITELRISDRPWRRWDILDCVVGKHDRASLTYAYISARDMILLCEMMTRLRILVLWANLNDLRDINFTGIKSKFYYLSPNDGQFYLNKEECRKECREPSIYNLKNLRLLSLRGLGKEVSDITCRFAFQGMKHLKYIELTGDTSITQRGRLRLHSRMRATGCKVNFCR